MNQNTTNYTAFDLEMAGLKPITDELISFAIGERGQIQNEEKTELDLLIGFSKHIRSLPENTILLTYMGGTMYSPKNMAFDLPVLRTKYVMNGIAEMYPFKGMRHIDVFRLIDKAFILDYMAVGVINDLDAPGVNKMAKDLNIRPESTKKATAQTIEKIVPDEQIRAYLEEKGIMKNKTHNGLKDACLLLLKIPDDGMRGKDVPPLFAEWKETGDRKILDKILTYNISDNKKTWLLFQEIRKVVQDQMMRPEIL